MILYTVYHSGALASTGDHCPNESLFKVFPFHKQLIFFKTNMQDGDDASNTSSMSIAN